MFLLSPEFLIPTISLFKTLMQRIEGAGIKWSSATQSAPHGFIGIALLIQVSCECSIKPQGIESLALSLAHASG